MRNSRVKTINLSSAPHVSTSSSLELLLLCILVH